MIASKHPHAYRYRLLRRLLLAGPILILVAFWLTGVNQGNFRVDTGLYSAIALNIYETGEFIDLRTGDAPYWNKPPLAFWIHGVFLWLLGPHLWVARLPSLLAAALTVLATMRTARVLAGPRVAVASGFVLATTIEFFRHTHAISLDLWLACFLTAAAWPAAVALRRDRPRLLLWSGLFVGLALLVKPLVGLLMPGVLAAWFLWHRRAWHALWLCPATAVALLVAAPWHGAMIVRHGQGFIDTYFLKQSIERATGASAVSGDPRPIWYYLEFLARTYWPWLLVLALALFDWGRGKRPRPRLLSLGVIGFGLWMAALAAFAGRYSRYFAPVYPFMSILCGTWLVTLAPAPVRRGMRHLYRWLPPAALIVSIGFALAGVRVHDPPDPKWEPLYEFLDANAEAPLWIISRGRTRAATCNIYLATGAWPRAAHIEPDHPESHRLLINPPAERAPRVGDLMLFLTGEGQRFAPRESDRIVFQSGDLVIARIEEPWTGKPGRVQ